jgi:hypothetical protein
MTGASCLCGAVTWEVDGDLSFFSHCHCSRCRKAHGTAFSSAVAVAESDFRLRGGEQVTSWQSAEGILRNFCRRCGSPVPGLPWQGLIFVPAGNFDVDPGIPAGFHIFVGSKAPWYEITDDLPRYDAYPEGVDAQVLPDRAPLDPPGGVRGSCLCGGVTFVVEGKPLRAHNCHCGRCRRARSAAHASNLFVTADGVRFTRGEDLLASYKLPGAKFFTQVFCRICGSKMPRIDRERNYGVIPMGGLDDDPGVKPQAHIFVGSKAPWLEINDRLPQFEEAAPKP